MNGVWGGKGVNSLVLFFFLAQNIKKNIEMMQQKEERKKEKIMREGRLKHFKYTSFFSLFSCG